MCNIVVIYYHYHSPFFNNNNYLFALDLSKRRNSIVIHITNIVFIQKKPRRQFDLDYMRYYDVCENSYVSYRNRLKKNKKIKK